MDALSYVNEARRYAGLDEPVAGDFVSSVNLDKAQVLATLAVAAALTEVRDVLRVARSSSM